MKTWHGYTGKILDVDLTSATLSEAELDRALAVDYMGGKGLVRGSFTTSYRRTAILSQRKTFWSLPPDH